MITIEFIRGGASERKNKFLNSSSTMLSVKCCVTQCFLYNVVSHKIMLPNVVTHNVVCTIICHTMLCHTMLYHTMFFHTILCHTMFCVPCCVAQCYVTQCCVQCCVTQYCVYVANLTHTKQSGSSHTWSGTIVTPRHAWPQSPPTTSPC